MNLQQSLQLASNTDIFKSSVSTNQAMMISTFVLEAKPSEYLMVTLK